MSQANLTFTEIEHKYVVDDAFDLSRFRALVAALRPTRTSAVRVRDRYFLTREGCARRFVIRHRYDPEVHQLTLKALEPDSEVRTEINLQLGNHAGDQADAVDAFVGQMEIVWSGTIKKNLEVWYLPDCEIVYYEASSGANTVRCVEFEALRKRSVEDARATLARYEQATGFTGAVRTRESLLPLLFPEVTTHLR